MESKTCKNCGRVMIVKPGKWGKFWACTGYPTCKTTEKYIFQAGEVIKVESKEFNPTTKQQTIFNEMDQADNLLISSGPGCAKTSTMIKGVEYVDSTKSIIMIAFNKSIASELQSRIKVNNASAMTLHSAGLKICKNIFGSRIKVKADKMDDIILTCGLIEEDKRKGMINPIKKALSLLNANMLQITEDNLNAINESSNLELEVNAELIKVLEYCKRAGLDQASQCVDFDDMIYLPLAYQFNPIADIAIVDESQDMSAANLELIARLAKRFIFVGDENQSIYAFRGADSESMQKIESRFNCKKLSLDETFRIPQAVVNFLNTEFPEITLYSHKPGGLVESIAESDIAKIINENSKVNILCRNNAPIVPLCYAMIRDGKKAIIRGKDISEGLINLILKNKGHDIASTLSNLEKYYNNLFEKFSKAKNKSFLDVIDDQIKTINAICESDKVNSVDSLIIAIQSLFSDNDNDYDIIFSTIHKAKGTESECVIVYQPELIGSKAKTDEEKKQERNLLWVAYSRTLNKLYITHK